MPEIHFVKIEAFEVCFLRAPIRTFSLELFYITYYIYGPQKVNKRMQYG